MTVRDPASPDDKARGHFANLCANVAELRPIHWVNPGEESDGAVEWLERGAPDRRQRTLGRFA